MNHTKSFASFLNENKLNEASSSMPLYDKVLIIMKECEKLNNYFKTHKNIPELHGVTFIYDDMTILPQGRASSDLEITIYFKSQFPSKQVLLDLQADDIDEFDIIDLNNVISKAGVDRYIDSTYSDINRIGVAFLTKKVQ